MKKRLVSSFLCLVLCLGLIPYTSLADGVSYTVSFDANGGTGTMAPVTVTDETYILPYNEFRSSRGYKYFSGWALSPDGEPLLQNTITLTGDTTLYATWADSEQIIDTTTTEYDHSDDTYNTVFTYGDKIIDDPGDSVYLNAEYKGCEKDEARWEITDIAYGEYELKTKGEDSVYSFTTTLTGIKYVTIYSGAAMIGGSEYMEYSVVKQERHYERENIYKTHDVYERAAAVTLALVTDKTVVPTPVYKGDITADGETHLMSEFYDLDALPSDTVVIVTVDGAEIFLILDDLKALSGADPVDDRFTLSLPSGYIFDCGETRVVCPFKILSSSVKGDLNGDGKVTLADVTLALKLIAGWSVTGDETAGDVTGDGKLNLSDVTLIMKYIAGWDVVLG